MAEMREVFVRTLNKCMTENEKIVVLDADLANASYFKNIENKSRFFNAGIAEANMVGVAAGLSICGFLPVIHTFAPFASRRCFDQMYVSGGYAKTNIKIYGSDPGIFSTHNGSTHTTFEDIALYRMIPNSHIYDPADEYQLEWLIKNIINLEGIHYIRSTRKNTPKIYDNSSHFELNKINKLQDGNRILILSMGGTLSACLNVSKRLKNNNIGCTLLDVFTLKPIDSERVLNEIKNKELIVTVENHSINNGLGSMISEIIAENGLNTELMRIGINEEFGQVGSLDYLQKTYGLDEESIYNKIIKRYAKIGEY